MADRTVTGENYVDVDLSGYIKGSTFGVVTFNIPSLTLTSAEIDIYFREGSATGAILTQISETDGITIIDANNFRIDTFDHTWKAGTVYYDIRIELATGIIKKPIYGTIKIKEDSTNE